MFLLLGLALAADADGDGYDESVDCDDTNPDIHPGADEKCEATADQVDDDCDGNPNTQTDPETGQAEYVPSDKHFYPDADGDGLGDQAAAPVYLCWLEAGYSTSPSDCNDNDASIPNTVELCNGIDDDCDGAIDNDDAVDLGTDCTWFFLDYDQDGWGDAAATDCLCAYGQELVDFRGDPYILVDGDCDDGDAAIHPGAEERLSGRDDDCDGRVAADEADCDADGYRPEASGSPCAGDEQGWCWGAERSLVCDQTSGWLMVALEGRDDAANEPGDCDDQDGTVYPGAAEVAGDGVDQDCDGADLEPEEQPGDSQEDSEGGDDRGQKPGCVQGCSGAAVGGPWLLALVGLLLRRRRDRPGA